MLITLSRRNSICQSAAEVHLTDVAPLGSISYSLFLFNYYYYEIYLNLGFSTTPYPSLMSLTCTIVCNSLTVEKYSVSTDQM